MVLKFLNDILKWFNKIHFKLYNSNKIIYNSKKKNQISQTVDWIHFMDFFLDYMLYLRISIF